MKKNLLIFIFFLILSAIFPADDILAEEDACIPPGPIMTWQETSSSFRCQETPVYRCGNNLCGKDGGTVESGVVWSECVTVFNCWDDGCQSGCDGGHTSVISGPYGPESIGVFQDVPDYKICSAQYNSWSPVFPVLECSGSCYPAPTLKGLDDSSLLPANVAGDSGYKLPINFGWEDNVEEVVSASPNNCQVESYEFGVVDPEIRQAVIGTQLQETVDEAYKLECQLSPNKNYQWKVRACRLSEAEDCGQWSEIQDFKVSSAPEPKFPYDKDWQGSEEVTDITIPLTVDWCDVKEAESYRLKIFVRKTDGDNEIEICHPLLRKNNDCESWWLKKTRRDLGQEEKILYSDFFDEDKHFFTINTAYSWQIQSCLDENGLNCENYSQKWSLSTIGEDPHGLSLSYPLDDPEGKNPVSLPIILDWTSPLEMNSYQYEVKKLDDSLISSKKTSASQSDPLDYPQLALNTFYKWSVKGCWDYEAKNCDETNLIEEWTFKTTGQPPQLISPKGNDVSIKTNFSWENVEGAKSYIFKIQGAVLNMETAVEETEFSLDYPDLKQETNYAWQVKSCTKNKDDSCVKNKTCCGEYSNAQSFRTFKITPPANSILPKDKEDFSTNERYVSWEKVTGAKAYQYKMDYLSLSAEEMDSTCYPTEITDNKTVSVNFDHIQLKCLGEYQWQVRSCLDENCEQVSDWSTLWTFNLSQPFESSGGGLVPCGRSTDNPDTKFWNERDACEIKHLFLLLKIIIDFLLWKIIPTILTLLAILSGVIFYFSLQAQAADPVAKVKSLWRAAGIGLLIIFFSWIIINLFLGIFGYQINVFGQWYSIQL